MAKSKKSKIQDDEKNGHLGMGTPAPTPSTDTEENNTEQEVQAKVQKSPAKEKHVIAQKGGRWITTNGKFESRTHVGLLTLMAISKCAIEDIQNLKEFDLEDVAKVIFGK